MALLHRPEPAYAVNESGIVSAWNEAAADLTGYAAMEVMTRDFAGGPLLPADEEGRLLSWPDSPLGTALLQGRNVQAFVYIRHREGHRMPVLSLALPVKNESGVTTAAVETLSLTGSVLTRMRRRRSELEDEVFEVEKRLAKPAEIRNWVDFQIRMLRNTRRVVGLILVDAQNIEEIGHRLGQEGQQRAVRMVANTLRFCLRVEDMVAMRTRKEYLVALRLSQPEELAAVGRRIARLLAASAFEWWGDTVQAACDVSVTLLTCDDTFQAALRRARAEGRIELT
jgi:GGDEF domain-containing protein